MKVGAIIVGQKWFYSDNGQEAGPFSLDQLKWLVANKRLSPDDLVWSEGMPDWVRAAEIRDLFSADKAIRIKPPPLPKAGGESHSKQHIMENPQQRRNADGISSQVIESSSTRLPLYLSVVNGAFQKKALTIGAYLGAVILVLRPWSHDKYVWLWVYIMWWGFCCLILPALCHTSAIDPSTKLGTAREVVGRTFLWGIGGLIGECFLLLILGLIFMLIAPVLQAMGIIAPRPTSNADDAVPHVFAALFLPLGIIAAIPPKESIGAFVGTLLASITRSHTPQSVENPTESSNESEAAGSQGDHR